MSSLETSDAGSDSVVIDGGSISGLDESLSWQAKKHRALTASRIAMALVAILGGSFLIHHLSLLLAISFGDATAATHLSDAFANWLPVVSGMTGSAITYYFTRSQSSDS